MTINEMIQRLEEYRDELGGDAQVRLMTQSSWPFEYGIFGLASGEEISCEVEDDDPDEDNAETDPVVYICEGEQLCYGAKRAWDVAY